MTEPKTKLVPKVPILIAELPRAEEDARKVFAEIQNNTYENKSLGKTRQAEEVLPCDCSFEPGVSEPGLACGEHADCINRLTQTECLESECRTKSHCQNQRFQRKQYADIHIVQTEKKGFGLRAATKLRPNDFIYEYIGEVVTETTLMRRMRAYADEGIQHFYFMMLQKGEFIDATKRGGIGRFANHSCNPNCYVAKWYVGQRIRMGIFAKRVIAVDEELTFNYNVDRYGHDAQPCYCGEPNCIGFIGGKTQTDVASMDDFYIEALGIDDQQVEALGLKNNRKKNKNKKKPLEELVLDLKDVQEKEVSSVVNAIRRATGSNKQMLAKLLTRVQMTEDSPVLRQFLRLRGLGLMADILAEYTEDVEIITLVLSSVINWPLANRIKIEDVGFEDIVLPHTSSSDENLQDISQRLLDGWSKLEKGYRIPRRAHDEDDVAVITHVTLDDSADRPRKRARYEDDGPLNLPAPLPTFDPLFHYSYTHSPIQSLPPTPIARVEPTKAQLELIIAQATAAAVAAAEAAKVTPSPAPSRKSSGSVKHKLDDSQSQANKDKRLLKLIGEVVVKVGSKYAKQMDKDVFKKYAQELTQKIAEKEKQSSTYATARLDKLAEDKEAKIKKHAKEYFHKTVQKLEKRKKEKASRTSSSSTSLSSSKNRPLDPRLHREQDRNGGSSTHSISLTLETNHTPQSNEGSDDFNDTEVLGNMLESMFGDPQADGDMKMDDIDEAEEETLLAEPTPDATNDSSHKPSPNSDHTKPLFVDICSREVHTIEKTPSKTPDSWKIEDIGTF